MNRRNSRTLSLNYVIECNASRDRFGSVDRASACGLKGPGFDSGQGHVPWLRAHPQWGGGARGSWSMILSHWCFYSVMLHYSELYYFPTLLNLLISLFKAFCDTHVKFHATLSKKKKKRFHILFIFFLTLIKGFLDLRYLSYTKNWFG